MNYNYYKRFVEDVEQAPQSIKLALVKVLQDLEAAIQISEVPNLQKLKGIQKAYFIRIDKYKLGLFKEKEKLVLARLLVDQEFTEAGLPETGTSSKNSKKISSLAPTTKKRATTKITGHTSIKLT